MAPNARRARIERPFERGIDEQRGASKGGLRPRPHEAPREQRREVAFARLLDRHDARGGEGSAGAHPTPVTRGELLERTAGKPYDAVPRHGFVGLLCAGVFGCAAAEPPEGAGGADPPLEPFET
jgi:hypothetical protein